MPPIQFQTLVDSLVPDGSELKGLILELLARKIAGDELDYEPRIDPINEFLDTQMAHYEQAASGMQSAGEDRDRQLDKLFRVAIKEVWGQGDEQW